jgi:hypothetical protein
MHKFLIDGICEVQFEKLSVEHSMVAILMAVRLLKKYPDFSGTPNFNAMFFNSPTYRILF